MRHVVQSYELVAASSALCVALIVTAVGLVTSARGVSHSAFGRAQKLEPRFVDELEPFTHLFEVINPTSRPVHIERVQCDCACQNPELGSNVILPNQKTTLRLSTTLGRRASTHSYRCILHTDYAEHPQWIYTVDIPVFPHFEFFPPQLAFGSVEPNEPVTRSMRLETYALAGEPHFAFDIACSDRVEITVAGSSTEKLVTGGIVCRTTNLTAKLHPGPVFGEYREMVALPRTTDKMAPETTRTIAATWHVKSPLEVSPRSAFFGHIRSDSGHT